ncbi:MAG: hypothetical protein GY933_00435 [Hyphomicrobiales bacterium]|nr:hypothetical protein [Hyphomicrobiales bacterium]
MGSDTFQEWVDLHELRQSVNDLYEFQGGIVAQCTLVIRKNFCPIVESEIQVREIDNACQPKTDLQCVGPKAVRHQND